MKVYFIIVSILILFLVGCAEPVPQEKLKYVGEWKALGANLLITKDGSFEFEKYKESVKTSISAPLKKITDDTIEVGILFMTTEYKVSSPPYRDKNNWKMTVDGYEFIKVM